MNLEWQTVILTYGAMRFDGSRPMAAALRGELEQAGSNEHISVAALENGLFCVEFVNSEFDAFQLEPGDWIVSDGELYKVYTPANFEAIFTTDRSGKSDWS